MFRKGSSTIILLIVFVGVLFAQEVPIQRPSSGRFCFDLAKALPADLADEINKQGDALQRHFDIDFVVAIIPSVENAEIAEYAANLFSYWEIGKSTQGKKGFLILIAQKEQRIKIEVGYDLEGIFTDAYVGQLEQEMLKDFLEQADWERGFLGTIEHLVGRIFRFYEQGEDVKAIKADDKDGYYSGGAGATTVFDFGAALKKPLPATPQEVKDYFGAQPTPEAAFQKYMEFNAKHLRDYTLDIFTDGSKEFFSHWRVSPGQQREEVETTSGKTYIVKEQGPYAVLMAPFNSGIDEFIRQCPYFFLKTGKGWQVDINTMSRALIMAGPTWHFMTTENPYMFAFEDYLLEMNRCYPKQGQKAFLGLTYALMGQPDNDGFVVAPEWDSPAQKAGIQDKDILISIDGEKITYKYQDWDMMKRYNPGDIVDVVVLRGGEKNTIKVTLGEVVGYRDEFPFVKKEGDPWLGFYFGYSEPYERDIEDVQLYVLDVVENSPAEKAGFKPGDLIYSVPVSRDKHVGFYDYTQSIKKVKPGDTMRFKVLRNLKERLDISVEVGSYSAGKLGF